MLLDGIGFEWGVEVNVGTMSPTRAPTSHPTEQPTVYLPPVPAPDGDIVDETLPAADPVEVPAPELASPPAPGSGGNDNQVTHPTQSPVEGDSADKDLPGGNLGRETVEGPTAQPTIKSEAVDSGEDSFVSPDLTDRPSTSPTLTPTQQWFGRQCNASNTSCKSSAWKKPKRCWAST